MLQQNRQQGGWAKSGLAAAVFAAVALASCTSFTPDESKTFARVGAEGAKLALPGIGAVKVPSGALQETVTVGVAVADAPVATPNPSVSQVLELTPHGTRFAAPVTVTLNYPRSTESQGLQVLRLANAQDDTWRPVGGAHFSDGVATFEVTTFSYYVVVNGYQCTPAVSAVTCAGVSCGEAAFCSTAGTCAPVAQANLCENQALYVINGELPADLVNISPEQTANGLNAASIAQAIASRCGLAPVTVNQADQGVLDPCNDAPLLAGGTTILLVGGTFSQRLAGYLNGTVSPLGSTYDSATDRYTFKSRAGATLLDFPNAQLSPAHDYFVIALMSDPVRGSLVFHVYGVGWEGTPAATWYLENQVLPEMAAGARSWQQYLLVEWRDDGDGVKGATDSFTVLARDIP